MLIATDAWHPQVSGVVRTLDATARLLRDWGHAVEVVEPSPYWSVPFPFYPGRAAVLAAARPRLRTDRAIPPGPRPHLHGGGNRPPGSPLLPQMGWRFTSSYHTRFPEYLQRLTRFPEPITYRFLKWFHGRVSALMVATPSLEKELIARGFAPPIARWSRGVDLAIFRPRPKVRVAVQAAGAALRRPCLAREGDRGLPAAQDVGNEARGRRRPARARAGTQYPRRGVPRATDTGGSSASVRRRRPVRLPEPDRHVRRRGDRGAGERAAGRGVPGHRAARHVHERQARRLDTIWGRRSSGARDRRPGRLRGQGRSYTWGIAPGSSWRTWWSRKPKPAVRFTGANDRRNGLHTNFTSYVTVTLLLVPSPTLPAVVGACA